MQVGSPSSVSSTESLPISAPNTIDADAAARALETKKANLKAAAASEAKTRRIVEGGKASILPDCCNVGIALRVFVAVNLAAGLAALVASFSLAGAATRLLETLLLAEPVLIVSLGLLCAARKSFNGAINGKPQSTQWAVGILIPATTTVLWASALWPFLPISQQGNDTVAFLYWLIGRTLFAGAAAWAIIEFLRLRALADRKSVV